MVKPFGVVMNQEKTSRRLEKVGASTTSEAEDGLWEKSFPRRYSVRGYPFKRGHPATPRPPLADSI